MTTKLATKGQIVIPKSIRDRFGMEAGDDFEIWAEESGELVLRPLGGKQNAGLLKHLRKAPGDLEIPELRSETPAPIQF